MAGIRPKDSLMKRDDLNGTPPLIQGERPPQRYFSNEGVGYGQFMVTAMEAFPVSRYAEIGTSRGRSLGPVSASSVAIDPKFRISTNVIGKKEACLFFQMTSDRFFERYDLKTLLGGPIDLAFLDGMHLFEYLLRDFLNMEKHCSPGSLIFMHDCMPRSFEMTARQQCPGAWTGDVWKVVPILRQYRPDLAVHLLDCRPTGLVMVTKLDPASRILENKYDEIVAQFAEKREDDALLRGLCEAATVIGTANLKKERLMEIIAS